MYGRADALATSPAGERDLHGRRLSLRDRRVYGAGRLLNGQRFLGVGLHRPVVEIARRLGFPRLLAGI
jgi:hypothetical protein